MDVVKQGSTAYVKISFRDKAKQLALPSSISYSTRCKTTGVAIKTNVAVTPATQIEITLDALDSAIQNAANKQEEKILVVTAVYGTNDSLVEDYHWLVSNLSFL